MTNTAELTVSRQLVANIQEMAHPFDGDDRPYLEGVDWVCSPEGLDEPLDPFLGNVDKCNLRPGGVYLYGVVCDQSGVANPEVCHVIPVSPNRVDRSDMPNPAIATLIPVRICEVSDHFVRWFPLVPLRLGDLYIDPGERQSTIHMGQESPVWFFEMPENNGISPENFPWREMPAIHVI